MQNRWRQQLLLWILKIESGPMGAKIGASVVEDHRPLPLPLGIQMMFSGRPIEVEFKK
jgi:hypothetical protein